jgi:phosphatidylglycerophosphatase A
MNRLAILIATVFGCGFFPKGPGTVGSLAGVAVAALASYLGYGRLTLLLFILVSFPVAVWAASVTERVYQREDPGEVVVDEVLGQWVALLGAAVWNWKTLLAAFLLFRLFDIWKPQPVRAAERLHGGLGIVADDVMAGIYAAAILYLGSQLRIN